VGAADLHHLVDDIAQERRATVGCPGSGPIGVRTKLVVPDSPTRKTTARWSSSRCELVEGQDDNLAVVANVQVPLGHSTVADLPHYFSPHRDAFGAPPPGRI
jgi:hypothetical protein